MVLARSQFPDLPLFINMTYQRSKVMGVIADEKEISKVTGVIEHEKERVLN